MKNFKTVAASAIISAVGLLGITTGYAAPAHALSCNTTSNGLTYCIQGTGVDRYSVSLQYGNETETFDIQCAGKYLRRWESYGNLNQQQADTFARHFCAL